MNAVNTGRDTTLHYDLPRVPDRAMWDIWLSMHSLPALSIADELEIFEMLANGPATAAEAAWRLGLNRRALDILFSMLAALGLVARRDGRHELTDLTRTYLLRESPYYWGPLLRVLGVTQQPREALIRALRATDDDGAVSLARVPSRSWKKGQMDLAQAEAVSRIMHCHSLPAAIGLAQSRQMEGVRRLLDVGGGSGCYSIALAQHLPNIRCSVMDLPAVCEVARTYIEAAGVCDQIDTVAVDMFHDGWPHGYDGVLFSNIFHDWTAETNLLLARRAYDALPGGGHVFLHEMLLAEDGSGPLTTASFSLLMMFGTPGGQYSFSELRQILTDAGFVDVSASPGYGYFSVVTGRKPPAS